MVTYLNRITFGLHCCPIDSMKQLLLFLVSPSHMWQVMVMVFAGKIDGDNTVCILYKPPRANNQT